MPAMAPHCLHHCHVSPLTLPTLTLALCPLTPPPTLMPILHMDMDMGMGHLLTGCPVVQTWRHRQLSRTRWQRRMQRHVTTTNRLRTAWRTCMLREAHLMWVLRQVMGMDMDMRVHRSMATTGRCSIPRATPMATGMVTNPS